jgi:hypothetical protein
VLSLQENSFCDLGVSARGMPQSESRWTMVKYILIYCQCIYNFIFIEGICYLCWWPLSDALCTTQSLLK